MQYRTWKLLYLSLDFKIALSLDYVVKSFNKIIQMNLVEIYFEQAMYFIWFVCVVYLYVHLSIDLKLDSFIYFNNSNRYNYYDPPKY